VNALRGKMNVRNRVLVIILTPAAVFLWLVGWCLVYASTKRLEPASRRVRALAAKKDLEIETAVDAGELVAAG
jgi:sensor domain CHASE-containing protein